ncbi:hypothetical protein BST61_g6384 [Cercospora zeina]
MKSLFFATAVFAALSLAAPVTKRQCFISSTGIQTCITNPTCTTNSDGSVVCVSKNKRDPLFSGSRENNDEALLLSKRQCYITEAGEQQCIDNPTCTENEDGTVYCVSKKNKRDAEEAEALQKRQCYIDQEGEQHCIDNPTCYKNEDGSVYCVSKRSMNDAEERDAEERDAEAEGEQLQKRQCYVDEAGEQHCIDNPTCYKNEDGSVTIYANSTAIKTSFL